MRREERRTRQVSWDNVAGKRTLGKEKNCSGEPPRTSEACRVKKASSEAYERRREVAKRMVEVADVGS